MFKQMIAFTAAALIASTGWAGECRTETLASSSPASRFSSTEATVTDNETTLAWMRCAVGQAWDGKQCGGEAQRFNWQQAMAMVDEINARQLGGHSDWRMPLVPELASIVERQCFNPRMNSEVFPGAPSLLFWSGMEKMGRPDQAYTLDFGGGAAAATGKGEQGAVRLVRGGPWWQPPRMMSQR